MLQGLQSVLRLLKAERPMEMNNEVWEVARNHPRYSNEEMELFKSDPGDADILVKAPELMNKTIVAEVEESLGCNSQQKLRDKFYLNRGTLISKLCPKRMCIHAVTALQVRGIAMNELLYAEMDADEMKLKRTGCFDGWLEYESWERIVMDVKMEVRKK